MKRKKRQRPTKVSSNIGRVIAVRAPDQWGSWFKKDPNGPEIQAFLNQMLDEELRGEHSEDRIELFRDRASPDGLIGQTSLSPQREPQMHWNATDFQVDEEVKVVKIVHQQRETGSDQLEQAKLREHLGQVAKVARIDPPYVEVGFEDNETARALADELSKDLNAPTEALPKPADFRGKTVKIVTVIFGSGAVEGMDENEAILYENLGKQARVVNIGKESVKLKMKNGDKCWAVLEEISDDLNAPVVKPAYVPTVDEDDDVTAERQQRAIKPKEAIKKIAKKKRRQTLTHAQPAKNAALSSGSLKHPRKKKKKIKRANSTAKVAIGKPKPRSPKRKPASRVTKRR